MNEENRPERRVDVSETVDQEVGKISKDDSWKPLKRINNGRQWDLMTYQ